MNFKKKLNSKVSKAHEGKALGFVFSFVILDVLRVQKKGAFPTLKLYRKEWLQRGISLVKP